MRTTSSVFRGVDFATTDIPMLRDAREAYDGLRATHERIDTFYAAFDKDKYIPIDAGEKGAPKEVTRFHPASLPPAKALPPLHVVFDTESNEKPPAQRSLSAVVHNARWFESLEAATVWDLAHTADTDVRHREMARFVSITQPGAGAWLEVAPDSSFGTRIDSDDFLVAAQRRYGLHLSMVVEANNVLEAAGEHKLVDRLGDKLAKEYNRRHNAILRGWHAVLRAIAYGELVLGDKEKAEKTALFNIGHHVDIVLRGAVTMEATSFMR
jgi:hypothetical protein